MNYSKLIQATLISSHLAFGAYQSHAMESQDQFVQNQTNNLRPLLPLISLAQEMKQSPHVSLDLQDKFLEIYDDLYNKGLVSHDDLLHLNLNLESWDSTLHTDLRFLLLCAQNERFLPETALTFLLCNEHDVTSTANIILARLYADGCSVTKDVVQAKKYIKMAIKQGNISAVCFLGSLYYFYQENKNLEKAFKYFQIAAKNRFAMAQNNLSHMFFNGEGVPQNNEKGMYYAQLAANLGLAIAQSTIGYLYYIDDKNLSKNFETAIQYLQPAADQGFAEAQYLLGKMHTSGLGVPENNEKAVYYYRLAADQGYLAAKYSLYLTYVCGRGADLEKESAIAYLVDSANQGYAPAQLNLGDEYKQGNNVPENIEKAIYYYQLAANQGCDEAQSKLKSLCFFEHEVSENFKRALLPFQLSTHHVFQQPKWSAKECMIEKILLFQEIVNMMNYSRSNKIPLDINKVIYSILWQYMIEPIQVTNLEEFHKAICKDAVNIVFDLSKFSYNSFNHSLIDQKLMLQTVVFKNLPNFDFEGNKDNYLLDSPTDIPPENTFSYNVFANAPNLESITLNCKIIGSLEQILFFDKNFFVNLPEKCIVNFFYPNYFSSSMISNQIKIAELKLKMLKCKNRNFVHINSKGTIKASPSILGWNPPQNAGESEEIISLP